MGGVGRKEEGYRGQREGLHGIGLGEANQKVQGRLKVSFTHRLEGNDRGECV